MRGRFSQSQREEGMEAEDEKIARGGREKRKRKGGIEDDGTIREREDGKEEEEGKSAGGGILVVKGLGIRMAKLCTSFTVTVTASCK